MSSTTSKRLRRVWGIVDGAYETGATMVSIAYLEAALNGGEKWNRLQAIADQAPMPPEEWEAGFASNRHLLPADAMTPSEYEDWYNHEVDRLESEVQNILNAPDAIVPGTPDVRSIPK